MSRRTDERKTSALDPFDRLRGLAKGLLRVPKVELKKQAKKRAD